MNNLLACCQLATRPLGLVKPDPTPVRNLVNLFAIQIFSHKKTPEFPGFFDNFKNYPCAPKAPVTA